MWSLLDNARLKLVCCLLQEMYFRHLYAVSQPSLQQRVESWQNYQALFNVILRGNVNMQVRQPAHAARYTKL